MQHAAPATQQAPAAAMADTDTVLRPMAPSALETMDFMKSPEMKLKVTFIVHFIVCERQSKIGFTRNILRCTI